MFAAARLSSPLFRVALLFGSAIALTACATLQPPVKVAPVASAFSAGPSSGSVDNSQTRWWLAFHDAQLSKLIDRGLAENLSVLQAIERIDEAGAGVISAGAGLPTMGGAIKHTTSSGTGLPVQAETIGSGEASWLVDLFGQSRLSRQAAEAHLDAAFFSVEAARLTFLSALTNAYIDLRYNQETLALTRSAIATRQETLTLTETLLAAGSGSRLDVLQARSALDSAKVALADYELGFIKATNSLATLTAQPSAQLRALQAGARQPWPQLRTRVGIPADLIRQRPDIRAAERQLIAASLEAGAAAAALYPSLSLSGNIQIGAAATWSFGPTLNLPFLDGGKARGNAKATQSRAEQAYLKWQEAILNAVEETENNWAAMRRSGQTVDTLQVVTRNAEEALALARESYQAGGVKVFDVLEAQRTALDAKLRLASATQAVAKNFVSLNVSLGGGASVLGVSR